MAFCQKHAMGYELSCPYCDNWLEKYMKSKAFKMARLRENRAIAAEKTGLVKLRIEQYVTPEQKERVLKYVARLKRGA